jgi:hypothetical protein
VEAAGVELEFVRFSSVVMAHDFWSKSLIPRRLAAAGVSPHVLGNPQYSTRFVEALWRRREPVLPVPAAVSRQGKFPPPPRVPALVRFARFVTGVARSRSRFNDSDSPMLAIPRLGPDDDFHVLAKRGE